MYKHTALHALSHLRVRSREGIASTPGLGAVQRLRLPLQRAVPVDYVGSDVPHRYFSYPPDDLFP